MRRSAASVELDHLEQLAGAPAAVRGAHPVEAALQLEELAPRLHRVEPDLLQRDADPLAHLVALLIDVEPVDQRGALARRQQRAEHPDRRRLAGPVGAEEPEDLPARNGEVDPAHGLDLVAEAADEPPSLDRGLCRGGAQWCSMTRSTMAYSFASSALMK